MQILPDLLAQESLRTLKRQLAGKRVIPFVGAGMSVPFGFMGWTRFLKTLAASFGLEDEVAEMLDLRGAYEEAAELLSRESGFAERVQDEFGKEPRRSNRSSPVELLPLLFPSEPVFTTNYDRVLEKVFENAGLPFTTVLHSEQGRSISQLLELREHVLIKLHGDFSTPDYRVLTLSDYRRCYGYADEGTIDESLSLPVALTHLFQSESVLFLGCGLNGDRYLRTMERLKPDTTHFAVMSGKPGSLQERFLTSCGIRPIIYPAQEHHLLETILKYLHGDISQSVPAHVTLNVNPPIEILSVVKQYFEKHPTGLPQLQETAFFEALCFHRDEVNARIQVITRDDSVFLESMPNLRVAGTAAKRNSIDLRKPAEGVLEYEFLGLRISITPSQTPSLLVFDVTRDLSFRFDVITSVI